MPCVDVCADPSDLREEDPAQFSYMGKEQSLADPNTAEELMQLAIVSWMPGIDERCPVKAAFAHRPSEGERYQKQIDWASNTNEIGIKNKLIYPNLPETL